jgi:hypothetical protein
MFKLIWNNNRSEKEKQEEDAGSVRPDQEQLRMLGEHFAIGKKIRYFPEYQRDIVFQTIILAYRVNDHFIYSRDAIRKDGDGTPAAFVIEERKAPLRLEQVTRLQLMVPDTSDMERSLDYVRRANLGRNGQFVRGNTITLIADTCNRGIPSLDTQVDSRIKLKDGPYLDNQMVLLRPDFDTLHIADQRQKARVKSNVPVNLYLSEDQPAVPCVLADFSDVSLRLQVSPGQKSLPPLKVNDKVVVVINLGTAVSTYRLKGVIFRATPEACVVRMKQLYKDGDFYAIKTMDVLEIKTGLLNR